MQFRHLPLVNSGASAVTDPEAALMVTNAINSIIGGDQGEGDTGSVGLEVTTKAVDATEVGLIVDANEVVKKS